MHVSKKQLERFSSNAMHSIIALHYVSYICRVAIYYILSNNSSLFDVFFYEIVVYYKRIDGSPNLSGQFQVINVIFVKKERL